MHSKHHGCTTQRRKRPRKNDVTSSSCDSRTRCQTHSKSQNQGNQHQGLHKVVMHLCLKVGAVPIEVHPHFPTNKRFWCCVFIVLRRAPDAHRRSRSPTTSKRTSARLSVGVCVGVDYLDRSPVEMVNERQMVQERSDGSTSCEPQRGSERKLVCICAFTLNCSRPFATFGTRQAALTRQFFLPDCA